MLNGEYKGKIRKIEEQVWAKNKELEAGETKEMIKRRRRCMGITIKKEKEKIWKEMKKDIIEKTKLEDDMATGKGKNQEKIEKQEDELEMLKEQVWDINKKVEKFTVPTILFGNVCSISGLTEQTTIRKQVIRDIIANEQPDIVGLMRMRR